MWWQNDTHDGPTLPLSIPNQAPCCRFYFESLGSVSLFQASLRWNNDADLQLFGFGIAKYLNASMPHDTEKCRLRFERYLAHRSRNEVERLR